MSKPNLWISIPYVLVKASRLQTILPDCEPYQNAVKMNSNARAETKKLQAVIIDDSETHRNILRQYIEKHPELNLQGSYCNGIEAKNNSCEKNADLIFLDIEMPFIDGFDLLESFKENPQIIIASGKPEHALRAFDYDVTDYLLKPISARRFDIAIKRALRNFGLNGTEEKHIFVKSNFRKVRVDYKDIKWIEALGDYVKLVTEKKNILVLTSMKAFEKRLPDEHFLRIHKSYIINLDRIENFNNTVVQVCGKQMPLSRKRKERLMDALGVR
jgi:DNA-binding LytR/AlgR family response regulator